MEKTSVFTGITNKPDWKDLVTFKSNFHESRLEVKVLDKNSKGEDDIIGYGSLFLDPTYYEGGKFRSQKLELFAEERVVG